MIRKYFVSYIKAELTDIKKLFQEKIYYVKSVDGLHIIYLLCNLF